jgi:tetratricopeptide (TPR) repeat protein
MSAATRIDELRKRYDENPRRFFAPLANEYRKSGDLEQAITLCQQHLTDQPGNMNGHVVYGQALYEAGRFDEAKTTFETALTLDPENLIALRHLGDIARTNGDNLKAREWYTRVLDADPRNDEIIAFIAEIDAAAPAAPSARAAEPLGETVTTKIEAQRRNTPVARPSSPTPASAMPTLQIEGLSTGSSVASSAPTPVIAQRAVTPPSAPTPVIAQRAVTPPSAPTPVIAQPAVTSPSTAPPVAPSLQQSLGLMDLSIDLGATADETPAPSIEQAAPTPAPAPIPEVDPMAEIDAAFGDFSFGDTPVSESPSALALDVTSLPSDAGTLEFDDIDLSMPRESAAPPELLSPAQPVEVSDPIMGYTPAFGTEAMPSAVDTPKPFVTETMAELYLQQGFRDEALDVYKQLAEENPLDASLRERVHELESGGRSSLSLERVAEDVPEEPEPLGIEALAPPVAAPVAPSVASSVSTPISTPAAAAGAPASRNAREFFSSIAARRAVKNEGTPQRGVATTAAATAAAPLLSSDGVAGPTVSSGGTLDSLFGGAEIASNDEHLALAFARVGESVDPATGVKGRPTQPAQDELSLDHVFRDTPPRVKQGVARKSETLRFDQFFAPAATAPAQEQSGAPPPPAGEPGSPAELEQFQDWLQQLKKP